MSGFFIFIFIVISIISKFFRPTVADVQNNVTYYLHLVSTAVLIALLWGVDLYRDHYIKSQGKEEEHKDQTRPI